MEIEIKSAKVTKKEHLTCTYIRKESKVKEGGEAFTKETNVTEDDNKTEIHPDLKKAFAALVPHLVLLCEFSSVKSLDKLTEAETEPFTVTSYSIGGKDDENTGIVLTGQKKLKTGKVMVFNTPFTRFEEDEKSGYRFVDDLQTKLGILNDEIEKFLFEGKQADPAQRSLAFPEGAN